MDETIEDRISQGRIGDAGMPFADRDLGGDQGGGTAITIIEDLKQVFGLRAREWVAEPVIEDE